MRSQSRGFVMIIASLLPDRARGTASDAARRVGRVAARRCDAAHSAVHDRAAHEHRHAGAASAHRARRCAPSRGSVVVMSAERHTTSAPARRCERRVSARTSTPRSRTSKPWLSSSETQMSLPMRVDVALHGREDDAARASRRALGQVRLHARRPPPSSRRPRPSAAAGRPRRGRTRRRAAGSRA